MDVLLGQHRRIDALFVAVESAAPMWRTEAFAALVEYLHKHEHAEQTIVHRRLREADWDAAAIVDGRLDEEKAADQALADLIQLGVDDSRFGPGLRALHESVRAHAAHEEMWEFPEIRRRFDDRERQAMANHVLGSQTEGW